MTLCMLQCRWVQISIKMAGLNIATFQSLPLDYNHFDSDEQHDCIFPADEAKNVFRLVHQKYILLCGGVLYSESPLLEVAL